MDTENGTQENGAQNATLGKGGYVRKIFVGVVMGVAIGVTVGLILAKTEAILDARAHSEERREQIAFFRDFVDNMQRVCDNIEELKINNFVGSADQKRHIYLRLHERHLRSALDGRSTRLTFDEFYEIDLARYFIQISLDKSADASISKDICSALLSNFNNTWLLAR